MERLKELRTGKKLNQQKLALDLDTTQTTISNYEMGVYQPDIDTLIKLAEYFGVTVDYLIGNSDVKAIIREESIPDDEIELLLKYRKLSANQKEKLLSLSEWVSEKLIDYDKSPKK